MTIPTITASENRGTALFQMSSKTRDGRAPDLRRPRKSLPVDPGASALKTTDMALFLKGQSVGRGAIYPVIPAPDGNLSGKSSRCCHWQKRRQKNLGQKDGTRAGALENRRTPPCGPLFRTIGGSSHFSALTILSLSSLVSMEYGSESVMIEKFWPEAIPFLSLAAIAAILVSLGNLKVIQPPRAQHNEERRCP